MEEMMHQAALSASITMQELFAHHFTVIMIRGICTDRGVKLLDKAIGKLRLLKACKSISVSRLMMPMLHLNQRYFATGLPPKLRMNSR